MLGNDLGRFTLRWRAPIPPSPSQNTTLPSTSYTNRSLTFCNNAYCFQAQKAMRKQSLCLCVCVCPITIKYEAEKEANSSVFNGFVQT